MFNLQRTEILAAAKHDVFMCHVRSSQVAFEIFRLICQSMRRWRSISYNSAPAKYAVTTFINYRILQREGGSDTIRQLVWM